MEKERMETNKTREEKTGAEQAREILNADRQQRLAACQAEVSVILARYRCELLATPIIDPSGRILAHAYLRAME